MLPEGEHVKTNPHPNLKEAQPGNIQQIGSRAMAAAYRRHGVDVVGMFNMDMVGYEAFDVTPSRTKLVS